MSGRLCNDIHSLITWSEPCDMQRFVEKYAKHQLPCLIRVAEGFAGADDSSHEFTQNEVYLIQDISRQKRVVATDRQDQYVSIPLDYKLKFHIIEHGSQSSPKPLHKIIDRLKANRKLDFKAEGNAPVSYRIGAEMSDKKELGLLRFDSMYDLMYLLAYPVLDYHLHPSMSAIPVYIPLMLEVAVGFKYGGRDQWEQFFLDLNKSIRRFDKFPVVICNDILLSDEPPESEYDYVKPMRMAMQPHEDDVCYDDALSRRSSSTTPSLSPPSTLSLLSDSKRPAQQRPNAYYVLPNKPTEPPAKNTSDDSISFFKPFLLPPIPTVNYLQQDRKRRPPVPPRARNKKNSYISIIDSDDSDTNNNRLPDIPPRLKKSSSVDSLRPTTRATDWDSASTGMSNNGFLPNSFRQRTGQTFADIGCVPTNIASLSVEEVCECLSLLRLDQYIDDFRNADVDGQLLCCLNENVLVADFSFSEFHATKLMMFALNGWRPFRRCPLSA